MNLNKISIDHLDKIISKLFGYYSFYSFGNDEANLYVGLVMVTIIASAILLIAKQKKIAFENPLISLSFLLFLNIGLVAFRVSVSSIHPYLAGPRYFFIHLFCSVGFLSKYRTRKVMLCVFLLLSA